MQICQCQLHHHRSLQLWANVMKPWISQNRRVALKPAQAGLKLQISSMFSEVKSKQSVLTGWILVFGRKLSASLVEVLMNTAWLALMHLQGSAEKLSRRIGEGFTLVGRHWFTSSPSDSDSWCCVPGKQHPCDMDVNFCTVPSVPTVSILHLRGHIVLASQGSKLCVSPLIFQF